MVMSASVDFPVAETDIRCRIYEYVNPDIF